MMELLKVNIETNNEKWLMEVDTGAESHLWVTKHGSKLPNQTQTLNQQRL